MSSRPSESPRPPRWWEQGRRGVSGLSMIEITIAVMVFAAAMIPVIMLTTTTTRRTFSMEKHLVAGQFAAGVLDRLLAMGFAECRQAIAKESYPRKVLDDPLMKVPGGAGKGGGFSESLAKTFKEFQYEVKVTDPSKADEKDQMFTITVFVDWPADPGSKVTRQFSLNGVKFHENP